MATPETLLFKLNGAQQTAQMAGLEGKTFTLGKVSTAGNTGLSKWMFLHPTAQSAGSNAGAVALKLEGTQQVSQLATLAGKTVTVGKAPATIGGTSKWLMLSTGKGALGAGAAAAGAGTAAGMATGAAKGGTALSQMVLVKAEGGRQAIDATTFAGKTFTVIKPPIMAGANTATNWIFLQPSTGAGAAGENIVALKVQAAGNTGASSLIGKSFTIGKAPMAAGAAGPQWLAFKPVTGVAAKGAAATAVALKGGGNCVATPVALKGGGNCVAATPVALNGQGTTAMANNATIGKTAPAIVTKSTATTAATTTAQATKAAVGGGTIWKGTGLSLGLGLGLGAWGPLLLLGAAAFGVGVYGYLNNRGDEEAAANTDLTELTLEEG